MILQYQLLCPSINYFEDLLVPVSPRVRSIACSLTCPGSCATGPPQQLPEEKIGAVQDSVAALDKQLNYMAQVCAILLHASIPGLLVNLPCAFCLLRCPPRLLKIAAPRPCATTTSCPPAPVLPGCCCRAATALLRAGATSPGRTAGARLSRS